MLALLGGLGLGALAARVLPALKRVFVISDMEGVAGICRWDQVVAGKPGYEEGRRLYTEELNAAVRGAFAAGATDVVVMDCHGAGGDRSFNSLVPDLLDPRAEFVVQTRWTEYTGFLEQGCDAALFVGQHAMAGAERGVLSHTVSSTNWHALYFNGVEVGEVGINAALCGTWGTPVVARHRRRRRLRGVRGAARPGSADARGQDRAGPLQRPPPLARRGPAKRSSRRPAKRSGTSRAPRSTTPGRPARSRSSSTPPTRPTRTATAPT